MSSKTISTTHISRTTDFAGHETILVTVNDGFPREISEEYAAQIVEDRRKGGWTVWRGVWTADGRPLDVLFTIVH